MSLDICAQKVNAVPVKPIAKDSTLIRIDSTLQALSSMIYYFDKKMQDNVTKDSYKLYSTQNIYNNLRLNTTTGQIDIVQWSLDNKKEGIVPLNREDLSSSYGVSDFELYPTQNIYTFILLDKYNGRMWHVQWGFEENKRWIQLIY